MKHHVRRTATGLALMGVLGIGVPVVAAAPASAATTCAVDTWGTVTADWLRVHTSDSVSSPAVGQIAQGKVFHYCRESSHWNGGYRWIWGYGYNNGVKLTGWVDQEYVAAGSGA